VNPMVLLCGIPTEPPLALVQNELNNLNIPSLTFNQRLFKEIELFFEISQGQVAGRLNLAGQSYSLEDFTGVYTRLMDWQNLPEYKNAGANSAQAAYCRVLHETLTNWLEVAACRVVNRSGPMSSNFSKPYQAQLIRNEGFEVPETLITNDPDIVRDFWQQHGRIIYKSISSVRSIVQTFEERDMERLDFIRWCPVQFQEYIDGINVRVHTIGSSAFATSIDTKVTDYRYAHRVEDGSIETSVFELSDEITEKCIRLSQALGLDFAGIDLKITPEKRIFCFEVNTSPGFNFYEAQTGQPIAKTLALYLSGS
jgi:glutathione synthase/RimK-type ligase-like ATP-grasp enzyme